MKKPSCSTSGSGKIGFRLGLVATIGATALFAFLFINTTQAHRYAHVDRTAHQHKINCSTLVNSKKSGPCRAFYVFPRSVRTIMITEIAPGKRYQCYFKGYHTWKKNGSRRIVRKSGLVGLSVNNLKYERGSGITATIDSSFRLRNPLQIDAMDSKKSGSMTFDLKNHTQENRDYFTVRCHPVHTFSSD